MTSLWEKQSFLRADIIIVGAGITGLSCAASLKEKHPDLAVCILERGILPAGASTKNAGFACFGSMTELLADTQILGKKGMVDLVRKRWEGLKKTINRIGTEKMDFKNHGGFELIFGEQIAEKEMQEINELLKPVFEREVFQFANERIETFGFEQANQLIENKLEAQIDSGKLIASLWDYCTHLGIRIHTGVEILKISEGKGEVVIDTQEHTFHASALSICTNAFTKELLKDEELSLYPGRGMVLSVIPKKGLKFQGTFHYDQGFYYFRDYYNRLIFGGGRNIDLDEECTTAFGINKEIKEKLISHLDSIILPHQAYEIEMEWSGIMAFGNTKEPVIKAISDRQVIGVRLGGMGVAIGSLVGEEVAKKTMELIR